MGRSGQWWTCDNSRSRRPPRKGRLGWGLEGRREPTIDLETGSCSVLLRKSKEASVAKGGGVGVEKFHGDKGD